jgi:uncharacterized protein YndB with AHSA1/START domain
VKLRDETEKAQSDEKARWVERETMVEASPEEVWEALTDEDRLEEWMAPDVELDPVEGGEISVGDGDDRRTGTVETVEEEERFAFTWTRPGEDESFVEFTIEPLPGGTRVKVVETAVGPSAMALGGWDSRFARLEHIFRFALVA